MASKNAATYMHRDLDISGWVGQPMQLEVLDVKKPLPMPPRGQWPHTVQLACYDPMTPAQAREVARWLLDAADLADELDEADREMRGRHETRQKWRCPSERG